MCTPMSLESWFVNTSTREANYTCAYPTALSLTIRDKFNMATHALIQYFLKFSVNKLDKASYVTA